MLDGSPALCDEGNIGNVENNNPESPSIPGGDAGVNTGNRAKQALLDKKNKNKKTGGRRIMRTTTPLQNQKPPKNCPNIRLLDHNNNTLAAQPGTAHPAPGPHTVLSLHHLKQGPKKELLKSKGGKSERGPAQPGGQPSRNLPRHDQITQNVNARSHKPKQSPTPSAPHSTKRRDVISPAKPPTPRQPSPREQKKPLHASNNVKIPNALPAEAEYLKDGEKVYAGAKFSEPPSPSVLPKPPSHWVGENEPQQSDQSREQMTVHLKSLLKVQDAL
ncbi:proline-rich nuclear receptor coactivator 1 [Mugil cephalus]|uniref:proline-rich nuclear receptor coactivator 1 n=1 Tax=Mugil cephalus TaxID=48193 RepID=UPI001FB717A0|nr:proline-rich nuclear receptor coactivator 1 [Mugil cephalus]